MSAGDANAFAGGIIARPARWVVKKRTNGRRRGAMIEKMLNDESDLKPESFGSLSFWRFLKTSV